ncbi:MAG: hypothetical protein QM747_16800 [Nocardioides sp.]
MTPLVGLLLPLALPALAGAVALPGRAEKTPSDVVLARGLACGLATWLLGSGLLTRIDHLTSTWVWVWDAVVAAVSLVVVLLPRHRTRLRAVLAPVARRLGAVVGLSALVFLPLGYTILTTWWSPLGSTPWYYYGLARQVAEAGSIPSSSIEFGAATPFLNDYHLFTTGTAMLLVQDPGHPMATVLTVTLLSLLLLGIGMAALTRVLGAGRLGSLLAVPIVVAAGIGPIRAAGYRPETFGLGLGLLMVALAVDWLRRRERASLVGAALLAACLSQVHGIAALSSGVMVAAAALVYAVRGPRREQILRGVLALAALAAGVVVVGLVFHEASGTVHAGGLVDRGGLADPTWEFFRAARGDTPSSPATNLHMIGTSWRELYNWQEWWMAPALVWGVYGLWRTRREAVTRDIVAFTLLSLLGLAVVASVFMFGWQGYVPRRTGASRIVLEASLLGPPLLAIGLTAAAQATWSFRGRVLVPTARQRALVLLGALCAGGLVSMVRISRYDNGQAPSRAQLTTWRTLPLTSHDVVLANGYTEGFIPDNTPAIGLLDGRAPYTFETQLHDANALLRGAQAFYSDPSAHWDYLARNHVTWVVVGDPHAYSLATLNVWDTPPSLHSLDACPGLRPFRQSSTLTVYRVVDSGPGGC